MCAEERTHPRGKRSAGPGFARRMRRTANRNRVARIPGHAACGAFPRHTAPVPGSPGHGGEYSPSSVASRRPVSRWREEARGIVSRGIAHPQFRGLAATTAPGGWRRRSLPWRRTAAPAHRPFVLRLGHTPGLSPPSPTAPLLAGWRFSGPCRWRMSTARLAPPSRHGRTSRAKLGVGERRAAAAGRPPLRRRFGGQPSRGIVSEGGLAEP